VSAKFAKSGPVILPNDDLRSTRNLVLATQEESKWKRNW